MKGFHILAGLSLLFASVTASAQTAETAGSGAIVVRDTVTAVPLIPLNPTLSTTSSSSSSNVFLPPTILAGETVVSTPNQVSQPVTGPTTTTTATTPVTTPTTATTTATTKPAEPQKAETKKEKKAKAEAEPKAEKEAPAFPRYTEVPLREITLRSVLFGLSTNLLLDAALAPNIGLTVPVGHHWSVQAAFLCPWWENGSGNFAYQVLHGSVGARYWWTGWDERDNGDPDFLSGWFLSASVGGGYYDLAPWGDGVQGSHMTASLGGGYSWRIGQNWRLDAFLGIGPMLTRWETYSPENDRSVLVSKDKGKTLFPVLPTSLGISIVWLVPGPRNRSTASH